MTPYLILLLLHILTFVPLNVVGWLVGRTLAEPLRFGRRLGPARLLFVRGDTLPLRLNLDLHLVLILGAMIGLPMQIHALLLTLVFFFGLVYMSYYYVIKICFGETPSLLDDLRFAKTGWDILLGSYRLLLIGALLGLVLAFVGTYALAHLCVATFTLQPVFLWLTMACIPVWLISIGPQALARNFRSPNVISPLTHSLSNLWRSALLWRRFTRRMIRQTETFQYSLDFHLDPQPNIHFIFIESYGLDFITNEDSQAPQLYAELHERLAAAGWISRSHISKANISGGKSWLSYSSVLKGMRIQSIGEYNYLYKDQAHLAYPPFLKILQDDGYATFLLNGLGGFGDYNIDWERMQAFLGFEQAILIDQLGYQGRYDGYPKNSPPDQFTLHKGLSLIRQHSAGRPHAYFNLTLNSHVPWYSPDAPVDRWQTLNDTEIKTDKKAPPTTRYNRAIRYQLEMLCQLILGEGSDQDLFILIGDHQPFHKAARIDDNFTIVHCISKSPTFSAALEEYGFTLGLQPDRHGAHIHHEGLMSLLLRSLAKSHGKSSCEIPQYTPNGVDFGASS